MRRTPNIYDNESAAQQAAFLSHSRELQSGQTGFELEQLSDDFPDQILLGHSVVAGLVRHTSPKIVIRLIALLLVFVARYGQRQLTNLAHARENFLSLNS